MEKINPVTFNNSFNECLEDNDSSVFNDGISKGYNSHQIDDGDGKIRYKTEDIKNALNLLASNFDIPLNKIRNYPDLEKKYKEIIVFCRLIYKTSNWPKFVNQIKEVCHDELNQNIKPGTIGSFLIGRIKTVDGIEDNVKNCSPISINSIPSDDNIGSCDQSVYLANWKQNEYQFICLKKNNDNQHKAIIFINKGSTGFKGLSQKEKDFFRDRHFYFLSLYYWNINGNTTKFSPIYPEPTPIKDIQSRGSYDDNDSDNILHNKISDYNVIIIFGLLFLIIALIFAWRIRTM